MQPSQCYALVGEVSEVRLRLQLLPFDLLPVAKTIESTMPHTSTFFFLSKLIKDSRAASACAAGLVDIFSDFFVFLFGEPYSSLPVHSEHGFGKPEAVIH